MDTMEQRLAKVRGLVAQLQPDEVLVFADRNFAAMGGQMRGMTSFEMGILFGQLLQCVDQQVEEISTHLKRGNGSSAADVFLEAVKIGRKNLPHQGRSTLREENQNNDRGPQS